MRKSIEKEISILLFWISGNINVNLNLKFEYCGCFNACTNDKVITNITYKGSAGGNKRWAFSKIYVLKKKEKKEAKSQQNKNKKRWKSKISADNARKGLQCILINNTRMNLKNAKHPNHCVLLYFRIFTKAREVILEEQYSLWKLYQLVVKKPRWFETDRTLYWK